MNNPKSWDLSRIAAALKKPDVVVANDEFDPNDTTLEEMLQAAGVGPDGMGAFLDYAERHARGLNSVEEFLEVISDWESDLENYIQPGLEKLKHHFHQAE